MELAEPADDRRCHLVARISDRTGEWGVAVTCVELNRMETRIKADLIRWAEGFATSAPPAAHSARSAPAWPLAFSSRNDLVEGDTLDVDITHSTLPGVGTVHHLQTRDGQRFGVMVDDKDRRSLLIYGGDDADVPVQTIVMEHDEADWVAEILHSRSVHDRLAVVERRLAELTGRAQ